MRDYAIVLANDIGEPARMLEVTKKVAPYVDSIKIGITSSMVPGVESIYMKARDIVGDQADVLADYKVADIGFQNEDGEWAGTNHKIVRTLSEAGAHYITCHTIVGISSIVESIKTAHANDTKVLTLPYMTHKGADIFFGLPLGKRQHEHIKNEFDKYGMDRIKDSGLYDVIDNCSTITDVILVLGQHFDVDGYIGPGNNPKVLENYRNFTDKEIWSPGFGRQNKKGGLEQQIEAWAKIVGPKSAMIVGSLIYNDDNPAKAAKEVMKARDKVIGKL